MSANYNFLIYLWTSTWSWPSPHPQASTWAWPLPSVWLSWMYGSWGSTSQFEV